MNGPKWLTTAMLVSIHAEQLRRYGGPAGIRDVGMLESARSRAENKWHYEACDLPQLAAAYAFGIAKNHPFIDGNKRAAFLASLVFLDINGIDLFVPEPEAVVAVMNLAAGEMDEDGFAQWIRDHLGAVKR
jgi:death-on-curing protein